MIDYVDFIICRRRMLKLTPSGKGWYESVDEVVSSSALRFLERSHSTAGEAWLDAQFNALKNLFTW